MSQISTAIQDNNGAVNAYDEDGNHIFTRWGELVGFTSTTVSIREDNGAVSVYDQDGNHKFTKWS